MSTPKVYIIILNWNGLNDTLECLESVSKLTYINYKVLVIDNASSDDSVNVISKFFPQIEIIVNSENLGFTGGNNVGIKYALDNRADYVWLLNNDTVVPNNCLDELIKDASNNSKIALISPIIKYFEDSSCVQFGGSTIDWQTMKIHYPESKNGIIPYNENRNDVCLWGTALLIKADIFDKIGYLNDDLFAYWEDTEYSLKSLTAGYINAMSDKAVIYHKHQISCDGETPKSKYYYYFMNRNLWKLMRTIPLTTMQRLHFFRRGISNLIKNAHYCSQSYLHEHVDACFNGYWHGILNIGGPYLHGSPMPPLLKAIIKLLFCNCYPFFVASIISGDYDKCKNTIKIKMAKTIHKYN